MSEKLKVVWLCHLSNKEIQDILHPWKRVREYAPWMFISLRVAEQDPRFEVHVVAPHAYIARTHEFELRGIHYHFYNPNIPVIGQPWPHLRGVSWDEFSDFRRSKRIVSRIINKINPDVIHLYGAENPYYSSTVLPLIDKYPTILTIQGFASHTKNKISKHMAKKIEVEQKVIRAIPICFYRAKKQGQDTLDYNPKMELLPNMFGSYELKYDNLPTDKKYDLVFFATICKDKGMDDLIKAVKIIKNKKPDISLCVIGGGSIEKYVTMCDELGVKDNVTWAGFQPTRRDVHFLAAQCRISVLPTYHDILPGTITESMFLGIPMVSYDVDSNPEINEDYEAVRLVKVGDVDALADNLYQLLCDDQQRMKLGEAGHTRAYEMFAPTNKQVAEQWMNGYQRAIELFRSKH